MKKHANSLGRMLLAFLFFSTLALGQSTTIPGGTIYNGKWSKAGSPYRVAGDLTVIGLQISPGVEVRVMPGFQIKVNGVLISQATAINPILFTSETGKTDWNGIILDNNSTLTNLDHCIVEKSKNREIPRDLETVCLKAMAKEAEKRYLSAEEFAADLGRFLAFSPVKARPMGPAGKMMRTFRRKPLLAALACLVLFYLVSGAYFYGAHTWNLALEKQKRISQDNYRLGCLAAQHGKWKEAIKHYRAAATEGFPDTILLAIKRVEALEGMLEAPLAIAELDTLKNLPDQGRHAARIDLLSAEYGVNRWLDPEEGLEQLRKHLKEGAFSGAEKNLVQAMLAEKLVDAKHYLEKGLIEAPYNRSILDFYGTVLLVTGNLAEAEIFARAREYQQPKDPVAKLFTALVVALRSKGKSVDDYITARKNRIGEGQEVWIRYLFDMARVGRIFEQATLAGAVGGKSPSVAELMGKVGPIILKSFVMLQKHRTGPENKEYFRMLPAIARGFKDLSRVFLPFILNTHQNSSLLRDAMVEATIKLGDGLYPFGLGLVHLGRKEHGQALAAFRVAERRPSVILTSKTPRIYQIVANLQMLTTIQPERGERIKKIRSEVSRIIATLLDEGELTSQDFDFLAWTAQKIRNISLEGEVVVVWHRKFPQNKIAKKSCQMFLLQKK